MSLVWRVFCCKRAQSRQRCSSGRGGEAGTDETRPRYQVEEARREADFAEAFDVVRRAQPSRNIQQRHYTEWIQFYRDYDRCYRLMLVRRLSHRSGRMETPSVIVAACVLIDARYALVGTKYALWTVSRVCTKDTALSRRTVVALIKRWAAGQQSGTVPRTFSAGKELNDLRDLQPFSRKRPYSERVAEAAKGAGESAPDELPDTVVRDPAPEPEPAPAPAPEAAAIDTSTRHATAAVAAEAAQVETVSGDVIGPGS